MTKILHFKKGEITATVEINLKENENGDLCLSICGEIKERRRWISAGQCIDKIAELIPCYQTKRIKEIWERWHLNDFHAGCEHQRAFEKEPYERHADCVCNICNYKYGTAWKFEKLPDCIVQELKNM